MKQTKFRAAPAALALAVSAMAGLAAPATAGDLVYASPVSETQSTYTRGIGPWIDGVKAASDGEVTIGYYGSGSIANINSILGAVTSGAADMGLIADVSYPGELPVSNVLTNMFVYGEDARIMAGAINQMRQQSCPDCIAEMASFDVVNIATYSLSPYRIYCKGKALKTLDDMKGLRIRATSAAGQLVAALGGTAVNITIPESYEAMQRGAIDCIANSLAMLKTYSFSDLADHTAMTPLGTYHGAHVFNIRTKKWNDMPEAQRKALVAPAAMGITGMVRGYIEDDMRAVEEARSKGITIDQPAPDLAAAISSYKAEERQRIIERGLSRGVENSETLISAFEPIIAEWTGIVTAIGPLDQPWTDEQWAAYQAELQSRIFDMFDYSDR